MTKKRFINDGFETIEDQSFTDTKTDKTYYVDYFDEIIDLLNELNDKCEFLEIENESLEDGATKYAELYHKSLNENEQLKSELQKIYEIATVNKVRDIVENVYDDLLYETTDESDYARKNVLKCLEMIDDYKDVIENV